MYPASITRQARMKINTITGSIPHLRAKCKFYLSTAFDSAGAAPPPSEKGVEEKIILHPFHLLALFSGDPEILVFPAELGGQGRGLIDPHNGRPAGEMSARPCFVVLTHGHHLPGFGRSSGGGRRGRRGARPGCRTAPAPPPRGRRQRCRLRPSADRCAA